MTEKLLLNIPEVNWAYTVLLDRAQQYLFGSSTDCVFVLPPEHADARQVSIKYADGAWHIANLGRAAATKVNDQPVVQQVLHNGDRLLLGNTTGTFVATEQASSHAELLNTQRVAERRQTKLQDLLRNIGLAPVNAAQLDKAATEVSGPSSAPSPLLNTISPTELEWVARELDAIISSVRAVPSSRDESYKRIVEQLRLAINADNGFVMIPESGNQRWVIRAWVGERTDWSDSVSAHPLPLTVTNRAFRMRSVVSNALFTQPGQQEPEPSPSMHTLKVNSYIAVPLTQDNVCRGVLYFDTRQTNKRFVVRDVKLLELAGACLMEIENETGVPQT